MGSEEIVRGDDTHRSFVRRGPTRGDETHRAGERAAPPLGPGEGRSPSPSRQNWGGKDSLRLQDRAPGKVGVALYRYQTLGGDEGFALIVGTTS